MKKNYKFHIITLILVISIICAAVISFAGCKKKADEWKQFETTWDIDFPEEITETIYFFEVTSWFNEGSRYAIFSFSQYPEEFLKDFEVNTNGSYSSLFGDLLEILKNDAKVEKVQLDESKIIIPDPNCIWRYMKVNNDKLLMAYDKSNDCLYVIENIS